MLYSLDHRKQLQGWSCGGAEFHHQHQAHGRHRYIIAVRCRLGSQLEEHFAMLDTAADRSIIAPAVAEMLEGDVGPSHGSIEISSRFGLTDARLHAIEVTLLADADHGRHIVVPSVCAFPSVWEGPQIVLGFGGFLEHIRIALQPSQGAGSKSMIYFGS